MTQAELFPILQGLDRLEAVLLGGTEIPLIGRRLVSEQEILAQIDSIRRTFPISADNNQEGRVSDDPASRDISENVQDAPVNNEYESMPLADSQAGHLREAPLKARSRPRLSRRKAVKVFLSDDEMAYLDQIARDSGLDRESVFRHLLLVHEGLGKSRGHFSGIKASDESISRINIDDMGAKPSRPTIELAEPNNFDEIPMAVEAIRDGSAVILNLTMMEPDQAQRAVDFAAGATFYGDGTQERVGESIFLFCPTNFEVRIHADADASESGGKVLIEGNSKEDSAADQPLLTELQESSLRLIRERWESGHQNTTPHDLVAELNPSSDSNSSFRLLRRVLFFLARQGLIQKIDDDDDYLAYKPVFEEDRIDSEVTVGENAQEVSG